MHTGSDLRVHRWASAPFRPDSASFIEANRDRFSRGLIIGGTAVVSEDVQAAVAAALDPPEPEPTPTEPTPPPSNGTDTFGDGTWMVPDEVAPGHYRISGGDGCYWERLSGFSGSFDDLIANGISDAIQTVTIQPDDVGFNSARCGTWRFVPPGGDGGRKPQVDLWAARWPCT